MTSKKEKERLTESKSHKESVAVSALILLLVYVTTTFLPPGVWSVLVYEFSILIIGLTALARVNDISSKQRSKRWHARRFGLTLMGVGASTLGVAVAVGASPNPTWKETLFMLGLAIMLFTTPNQEPWWKWISHKDKVDDPI